MPSVSPIHPAGGVQREEVPAADLSDQVPDTESETKILLQGEMPLDPNPGDPEQCWEESHDPSVRSPVPSTLTPGIFNHVSPASSSARTPPRNTS